MANSPSSQTASVSRHATPAASATTRPRSCRRASAAYLSFKPNATNVQADILDRRANCAPRAGTKAYFPRGSRIPAASLAAGGAGVRATTVTLGLETARASRSTSLAPDAAEAGVLMARSRTSRKTVSLARPAAIPVRRGPIKP